MDISVIQQVIETYGYQALFAGAFIEGETFFILGGIAARQGLLDPWFVGLAAGLGGFLGDQVFFLLGLLRIDVFGGKFNRYARKAALARRLVRRHSVLLVLLSRFLYGFRMVVPLACGASGIRLTTFMALNFVSALLWTLTFGGLGYWFGGWVSHNMDMVKNLQIVGAFVLGMLLISLILGRLIHRRIIKDDKVRQP